MTPLLLEADRDHFAAHLASLPSQLEELHFSIDQRIANADWDHHLPNMPHLRILDMPFKTDYSSLGNTPVKTIFPLLASKFPNLEDLTLSLFNEWFVNSQTLMFTLPSTITALHIISSDPIFKHHVLWPPSLTSLAITVGDAFMQKIIPCFTEPTSLLINNLRLQNQIKRFTFRGYLHESLYQPAQYDALITTIVPKSVTDLTLTHSQKKPTEGTYSSIISALASLPNLIKVHIIPMSGLADAPMVDQVDTMPLQLQVWKFPGCVFSRSVLLQLPPSTNYLQVIFETNSDWDEFRKARPKCYIQGSLNPANNA